MLRRNKEPEYRRRIRENIDQQKTNTDDAERAAYTQANRQKIISALERITQQQHTYSKERKAAEKDQARRDWRQFWVDFVGIIGLWAAAGVGVIAIWYGTTDAERQRGITERQLTAMQGQLDEMRAEHRPWLAVNAFVTEPFVYDPNGTNISLLYVLHNTGNLPANNVSIELDTFPMLQNNLDARERNVCNGRPSKNRNVKTVFGYTIFPGETINVIMGQNITKAQIDGLNEEHKATSPNGFKIWIPTILSCVVYRSPYQENIVLHTPLILNLVMKKTALRPGRGCCAILIEDSPIEANDLEVRRDFIDLPAD